MKMNRRFIAAIIRAAKSESAPLPWSRKLRSATPAYGRGQMRKLG